MDLDVSRTLFKVLDKDPDLVNQVLEVILEDRDVWILRYQLVPRHRGFDGFGVAQDGQVLGSEEHLDAARHPRPAADEPEALQREHHLVHGLGRRSAGRGCRHR